MATTTKSLNGVKAMNTPEARAKAVRTRKRNMRKQKSSTAHLQRPEVRAKAERSRQRTLREKKGAKLPATALLEALKTEHQKKGKAQSRTAPNLSLRTVSRLIVSVAEVLYTKMGKASA